MAGYSSSGGHRRPDLNSNEFERCVQPRTAVGRLVGHGVRGGQAMITTLRRRLIAVPARLIRHARGLALRLPPGNNLLAEILARLRALP